MQIVIAPVLLLSLVLVLASCAQSQEPETSGRFAKGTHERDIVDWYQEARTVMADRTPGASGCERQRSEYVRMSRQMRQLVDEKLNFEAEMTSMKRQAPPSTHRELDAAADEYAAYVDQATIELFDSYRARTGWDSDALDYCTAMFLVEEIPDICDELLVPGAGFSDYGRFGYAEYCIENRVPPYDN